MSLCLFDSFAPELQRRKQKNTWNTLKIDHHFGNTNKHIHVTQADHCNKLTNTTTCPLYSTSPVIHNEWTKSLPDKWHCQIHMYSVHVHVWGIYMLYIILSQTYYHKFFLIHYHIFHHWYKRSCLVLDLLNIAKVKHFALFQPADGQALLFYFLRNKLHAFISCKYCALLELAIS